ncbi:hypothetical protein [Agromyces sp. S2-1-8]|uniref:hypothetical protein n=1 Tax=Agromyces sp. S2-1-8 TaxID=2897180 RepID=UPI001E60D2EC|nr:hypothetical protein [Agromyces sp. S2-1-8]MCD5345059.1 hypothetical protein [Agromyces sp. S2-1-8]
MPNLTSPDNLPYPAGGDEAAPLDQWIEDLANAVQAAVTARFADTGWVDCPLRPGITMQGSRPIQVRKLFNKLVLIDWGVAGAGLAASTGVNVADVPVDFRPTSGTKYINVVSSSTASTGGGGRWQIDGNGVILLTPPATTGGYYLFPTGASYMR